jgi:ABC-type nitrate/sulfonate/bicarbonate transport system substrate-binding protein
MTSKVVLRAGVRGLIRWAALTASLMVAGQALSAPLRIAVSRSPLSLPIYVAESQGFFTAEGVTVRTSECIGGYRCLRSMFDGDSDLATAADTPIVFTSFERSDFMVLATFATTSRDLKLVGKKDAGIATPREWSGKKVGVVRGAASHYFVDALLLMHGVDPHGVQMVWVQPEEVAGALAAGRIDVAAVWEPYCFAAVKALAGNAYVVPSIPIYTVTFNLVASRRLAGVRDADFTAMLRAIGRAERFIAEQPEQAQRILKTRLGLDQSFVDWVWRDLHYRLSLDQALIRTLESEAQWAVREGHVKPSPIPNFLSRLHAEPLNLADPRTVGLLR